MTTDPITTGGDNKPQEAEYQPDDKTRAVINETNEKFDRWRADRKPHEQQWFINAAFLRGHQYVEWNAVEQRLRINPVPSHRQRMQINRVLPKFRARLAKFLKQRPTPIVVPASTERDDRLNARATQKVLDYQWRRGKLEGKYRDALLWSSTTGKGFWWFYWDPLKTARVKDPMTGQAVEAQLGDVCIEVGSPFELLVSDPGEAHLSDQPEIMRVKLRPIEDVKQRYPQSAPYLRGRDQLPGIFPLRKADLYPELQGVHRTAWSRTPIKASNMRRLMLW
jgi:hypothetical protein